MSFGKPRVDVNDDVVYITTPSCIEITHENPSCKPSHNITFCLQVIIKLIFLIKRNQKSYLNSTRQSLKSYNCQKCVKAENFWRRKENF